MREITIDPRGSLAVHWHHSEAVTEDIPFWSKHGSFNGGGEGHSE